LLWIEKATRDDNRRESTSYSLHLLASISGASAVSSRTKFMIPRKNIKINAMILIDHLNLCANSAKAMDKLIYAYPTVTFKLRNAIGRSVPPIEAMQATMPKAVDRLLLNQWAMIPIIGPKMIPHDAPTPKP